MPQQPKKSNKRPDTPLATSPNPVNMYKGLKDAWGNPVGGEGTTPPFTVKKNVVKKKK